MNIKEYLSYWDNVVCDWFCGRIDKEQRLFIDDISLKLNILHMPEPYWGNPEICSIVIANYNPGGGADRNRHTFHDCANCPESFINQVKNYGYSNVVKPFPIIDEPTETFDKEHPCWWKEYGGRKWWLNKMKWINKVLGDKKTDKKPFAIELCGWHSEAWPSNACIKAHKDNESFIKDYFIEPFTEAIQQSDLKVGICVGKQFYDLLMQMSAQDKMSLGTPFPPYKFIQENKQYDIRLFNINNAQIIVIWGKGRNRYPSIDDKDLSAIQEFIQQLKQ